LLAIKEILKSIDNWILKTISKLPPVAMLAAINFRQRVLARKTRFKHDLRENIYFAVEESEVCKRYFLSPYRGFQLFQHGIKRRGDGLASDYLVDGIAFSDGDTIVDVGANTGDFHLFFEGKRANINYFGFEPAPNEFKVLQRNVPHGIVFQAGCWYTNTTLTFFLQSEKADSSLIEPKEYNETVRVDCRRLDDMISGPIKLLKIEAEGAEPEVIAGAEKLLESVQWITVDVGCERGKNQESTLVHVTNSLLQRGFKVESFNPSRLVMLFKNAKEDVN
jgi:FkbM family methyltransferase